MLAKDANIKLEPLGTNLEELRDLQDRGCVAQAKKLLNILREARNADTMEFTHSWDTEHITECLLKRLDVEPEFIGTTYAELKDLEREALLIGAKDNLRKARVNAGVKPISSYVNFVMNIARRNKIPLEEIGTGLKELDQLHRIQ